MGSVSLGALGGLTALSGSLLSTASGAVYASSGVVESFASSGTGVEQSFKVSARPLLDLGSLVVEVPISGLTATADNGDIGLADAAGQIRATYSDLRVTDATGAGVPATMAPAAGGSAIEIDVDDAAAVYPLTIDPIFEQVSEVHASTTILAYATDQSWNVNQ